MRPGRFILGPLVVTLLAVFSVPQVRATTVTTQIRYLSSEHVYIDAGAIRGLQVGSTAEVRRDGKTIAYLEILHVADHSASCRVVGEAASLAVGDEVVAEIPDRDNQGSSAAPPPSEPSRTRTFTGIKAVPEAPASRRELSGSLGVQWDHTDSDAEADLRTDFWAMPLNFEVSGLGKGWEWHTRVTFRRFERSGYTGSTPAGQWRNRIREIALVQDDPEAVWNLAVGRVRSRISGPAGPFDGLLAERRIGAGTYLGLFGGFAPEWGSLAFGTDDHLAGLSLRSTRRTAAGRFMDLNLTGLGRYRGGQISREYFTWTISWRNGAKLSLLQAAEIDLNRGWRREAQGRGLSLSSLALTGRWEAAAGLHLDLGFDNRQLVRTWESRSLPDSLFEDSGHRGWRAGLSLRSRSGRLLALSGSVRRDEGLASGITSWNGRLLWPRLTPANLTASLSVRGFDGPYLSGWAPQAGLSLPIRTGRIGLDGGYYVYKGMNGGEDRTNTWLEVGIARDLARVWTLTAEFRRDWGDDIAGRRWQLGMRRRF